MKARRLSYLVAVTLDGFIAHPDRSDPTGPDGFWPIAADYVEHVVGRFPETLTAAARAALGLAGPGRFFDTALMGRRTYQIGLDAGVTNAYPHLRTIVFSRTLGASPDPSVEVEGGDPVQRVRSLKQEPGAGLWLVGGGSLAGSLYDQIDELILKVTPITIGAGVPLFGDSETSFRLRSWTMHASTTVPSGVSFVSMRRLP